MFSLLWFSRTSSWRHNKKNITARTRFSIRDNQIYPLHHSTKDESLRYEKQKPQKPSGAICSLRPSCAFMALRMKASFHASPDAIMALHAKHRQHQSKNPGFQPKKSFVYRLRFTVERFWCYASSLLRHGKAQTSLVSAHGLNAAFRLCGSFLHLTSYILHL